MTAPVLPPADLAILTRIAAGETAPLAARNLGISERTLRRRITDICRLLGVDTPIEAVTWAAYQRLITPTARPLLPPPPPAKPAANTRPPLDHCDQLLARAAAATLAGGIR